MILIEYDSKALIRLSVVVLNVIQRTFHVLGINRLTPPIVRKYSSGDKQNILLKTYDIANTPFA